MSESGSVVATTDLPEVDQLPLDASLEDELTAEPDTSPDLNHGEYRVEYRDAGTSTWTEWGTISHGYASGATIQNLLDGQEYDVRARAETVDVTGEWHTATKITLLPVPGTPTFSGISQTSLEAGWSDNADNEVSQQIWRRRVLDGWDWELFATVDPDVESIVDDTVQPDTEFEYRIRTLTQYVYAESDAASVTTQSSGATRVQLPPEEWVVEIETPSGQIIRPRTLDDSPTWSPGVLGVPDVEIPVPDADRWRADEGEPPEGWPMRVWYQGKQLPIEELVEVSRSDGVATLRGVGGRAMQQYVANWQVDEAESHTALQSLLSSRTDYQLDIDAPTSATQPDVEIFREGGGNTEPNLASVFSTAIDDDTVPLAYDPVEGLRTTRTSIFYEAEDESYSGLALGGDHSQAGGNDPGDFSGDRAVRLSSYGDYVEIQFQGPADPTFDHTIPNTEYAVGILIGTEDGDRSMGFETTWNGTFAGGAEEGIIQGGDATDLEWQTWQPAQDDLTPDDMPTWRLELVEHPNGFDGDTEVWVDAVVLFDSRYDYTMDENPTNGLVDGPENYPDAVRAEGSDVASVFQILSATVEGLWSSTQPDQLLGISTDQGQTWDEATGSDAHTVDYSGSPVQQVRPAIELGRQGERTSASPATGVDPQSLASVTITADLDDTPVLVDRRFEDRLDAIATNVARDAGSVWELQRDPSARYDNPDGNVLRYTARGQRTRGSAARVVDVSASRTLEESADCVIVEGSSNDVSGEEFQAGEGGLDQDNLTHDHIVPTSETVYDPDTETEFERGTDYRILWAEGRIEYLEGTDLEDLEFYQIDYRHKPRGKAPAGVDPEGEDVRTIREEAPTATTDLVCEQLAVGLLTRVQDPLEEVDIGLTAEDPTASFVAALDHPEIPFSEPVVVDRPEYDGSTWTWTAQSRRSVEQIFGRLQRTVRELAEQT